MEIRASPREITALITFLVGYFVEMDVCKVNK